MAMKRGESRAEQNKRIKKEALIEYMQKKGLCEAVISTCEKLADLGHDLSVTDIQRLKAANDGRLALIKKYLPDAKAVEISNKDGEAFKTDNKFVIEVVRAASEDTGENDAATEAEKV